MYVKNQFYLIHQEADLLYKLLRSYVKRYLILEKKNFGSRFLLLVLSLKPYQRRVEIAAEKIQL